ncbi:leucine-rich repeat-containing protein 51-like [Lingula anatina]|uniref:Leucine-rich repeat-containing protein 51 n=1 Tax=Lingula anatina TaxID=7574 RepID=A0A1S3JSZ1_LINAN|nr:leucine-rich repeat-containing protein 51-like [Lingula anatina]|eukprot:XP_013413154.1 leucine-rich repeat-containing protein 51-like [Lingula anatina]
MSSPRKAGTTDKNAEILAPLDFSFMTLTTCSDVLGEEPRLQSPRKSKPKKSESGKYLSHCLRLNNNNIADFETLEATLEKLVDDPLELQWLDLSFNELTKLDPVLGKYPNLQILYLHGNGIADLKEVDNLATCRSLRKLTLHGNPIENIKGYRSHVLSKLPNLADFDFSRITKADRATADTYSKLYGLNKKTKKKKEAED